jgi:lysophospholipase L1-like esterase
LLEKAIELSGHRPDHVFVLSIPDYGVTPFGQKKNPDRITDEINRYNTINKRLADSLGVHYFNITPVTRMASSRPELLAEDRLHPSGLMYKSWVEQITPVLLSEIRPWRIK